MNKNIRFKGFTMRKRSLTFRKVAKEQVMKYIMAMADSIVFTTEAQRVMRIFEGKI